MKNIKTIFTFLIAAVLFVSCEEYEDYDSDITTVGFTKMSTNINRIPEGGSKEEPVNLFVSDVSNTDRTFTIIEIPVESDPAAPENYSYPSTVIIPAGTRSIDIPVTAVDVSISPDTRTFFTLAVKDGAGFTTGGRVTIGLKN